MTQAFSHEILSGSTNGLGIKIAATATAGTLIHTAIAGNGGTTSREEVELWAVNQHTASVDLTIEFGGATAPDQNITITLPPKAGPRQIVPGFPLRNSLTVKGFADVANVVMVYGHVRVITVP